MFCFRRLFPLMTLLWLFFALPVFAAAQHSLGYVVFRDKDRAHTVPRFVAIAAPIRTVEVLGTDGKWGEDSETRVVITTENDEHVVIMVSAFIAWGEQNEAAEAIAMRLLNGENILVEKCGRYNLHRPFESITDVLLTYETEFVCEYEDDFQLGGYDLPYSNRLVGTLMQKEERVAEFVIREKNDPAVITELPIYRFRDCLAAETFIATPTGQTALEKLKAGDLVYSYDRNAKQVVIDEVAEDPSCFETSRFVELNFRNSSGEAHLISTQHHPFFVTYVDNLESDRDSSYLEKLNRFVPAGRLTVNSRVALLLFHEVTGPYIETYNTALVSAALRQQADSPRASAWPKRVCNVEIATFHNFFANGLLVHNKFIY